MDKLTTQARRAEVAAVISRGEWSGPMCAQIAAKYGVTAQSINNDRRRIQGIRKPGHAVGRDVPKLHILPASGEDDRPTDDAGRPMALGFRAGSVAANLSSVPRSIALGWLLDNVAIGITSGDPASGPFMQASKEIRAILTALDEAKKIERDTLGDMSEDDMVALFRAEIEMLPRPALKKLRAALLAG